LFNLIAGAVGEGLAVKFMAHRKVSSKMPNPSDILNGKVKDLNVKEISAMYSLTVSLCYELKEASDKNAKNWNDQVNNFFQFMMDNFETELVVLEDEYENQKLEYLLDRELERGTELTFKPNWREDEQFVQCCYMDNRLGVWSALKVAETLTDGVICFSTYEEHKGGTAGMLARIIYERWNIQQALISDITWITEGVKHGQGVVISMRDSGIPRRSYLNKIIHLAKESSISFQLEVEATGGSDGNQIQASPYPIDWIFIGAPEDHVHTPDEKVHKKDIESMVKMYSYLMKNL
jgi:hypothetical protein